MTQPVQWDCSEYGLAALLLAQLKANLEVEESTAEPASLYVVHPGSSVPGYAELGGDGGTDLAWTRVVGVQPVETKRPDIAGIGWWVILEMGIYRCYPIPARNAMPALGTIDTHARLAIDDVARMRDAIRDFHTVGQLKVWPGNWDPLPTRGGLHGGKMTVRTQALLGGYPDTVIPPIGGTGE